MHFSLARGRTRIVKGEIILLTKNCKSILYAILSLDQNEWYKTYSVTDLSQLTSLSSEEIVSAVNALEENNMVEVHRLTVGKHIPVINTIRLTELGIHYKDQEKENRLNYLKDKWIDFLALIIALIALLKSFEPELATLFQK